MKWLVMCLAARVINFYISVEPPWKIINFDFRHFINPERYEKVQEIAARN